MPFNGLSTGAVPAVNGCTVRFPSGFGLLKYGGAPPGIVRLSSFEGVGFGVGVTVGPVGVGVAVATGVGVGVLVGPTVGVGVAVAVGVGVGDTTPPPVMLIRSRSGQ